MLVQEMIFAGEDYSKLICLRDELVKNGETYQFIKGAAGADEICHRTKLYHFAYPHNNDQKCWERTLVTLYLFETEKRGLVSFITPSVEAFQKAAEAVRKLIAEPTRETKSSLDVICMS